MPQLTLIILTLDPSASPELITLLASCKLIPNEVPLTPTRRASDLPELKMVISLLIEMMPIVLPKEISLDPITSPAFQIVTCSSVE